MSLTLSASSKNNFENTSVKAFALCFVTFPSTSLSLVMSLLVRGLCDISKIIGNKFQHKMVKLETFHPPHPPHPHTRTHTHTCSWSLLQWKSWSHDCGTCCVNLCSPNEETGAQGVKRQLRYITIHRYFSYIKELSTVCVHTNQPLESRIHSNVPV